MSTEMKRRAPRIGWVAAALVMALAGPALARKMAVVDSQPRAQTVVDGRNAQYFVRFDGPVDHRQAALMILDAEGETVSVMHPLLDSAPNVLFASGPRLEDGSYELRWVVRSVPDGEVSEGTVPFTVKN